MDGGREGGRDRLKYQGVKVSYLVVLDGEIMSRPL